jgi:hypothetical protein
MGSRKAKTRPRRPTSLELAQRTVAGLEECFHARLEGLSLPTDPVELIYALQKLDEDSPLAPLKDTAYYAVIYLEMTRDQLDPLNQDPDHLAAISHVAMATSFIEAIKDGREQVENRRQRSAAAMPGARVRAKRYKEQRLALTEAIDKRIHADPKQSDSAIADQLLITNSELGKSTLRRWIRGRRSYLQ